MQRLKTIGEWPLWTLEAARIEAGRLRRDIDIGADPLADARRHRAAPTIKELAAEWLDKHASGLKSEKDIRVLIGGDLVQAIGKMTVADLRRRHVIEAIEAKAINAPRQAAILLTYARRLLDFYRSGLHYGHPPCRSQAVLDHGQGQAQPASTEGARTRPALSTAAVANLSNAWRNAND